MLYKSRNWKFSLSFSLERRINIKIFTFSIVDISVFAVQYSFLTIEMTKRFIGVINYERHYERALNTLE